jgi:tRNA(His) guanylyltransferase
VVSYAASPMANSKYTHNLRSRQTLTKNRYEYVRAFEQSDVLLPNTFIVIRIDGRGFHKCEIQACNSMQGPLITTRFTTTHNFLKPNDQRGLDLMNSCAISVMKNLRDIEIGYGTSDEFRFDPKLACLR